MSCPVSQNFSPDHVPLKRLGILSKRPFDGFVAIRLEVGSLLPLGCVALFTLLVWEHARFVKQHLVKLLGANLRTIFMLICWCISFWYVTFRTSGWLFLYINEQWYNLIATQIFLTLTDVFCNAALFGGYLESVAKGDCEQRGRTLDLVKALSLGIKFGHLQFTVYDITFGGSTVFGDHLRNFLFCVDDALFVWLFQATYLRQASARAMFEICTSNAAFWIGLMSSQQVLATAGISFRVT